MKFEEFVAEVERGISLLSVNRLTKPPEIDGKIAVFTFAHGTGKLQMLTDRHVRAVALLANGAPSMRAPDPLDEDGAWHIAKFFTMRVSTETV